LVQQVDGTSPLVSGSLLEAGQRYAEAKRAWSETFLFYYNQPGRGNKPRTVAEAQAMADQEVNVTAAMVEWEYYRCQTTQSKS
jgi:hypothetical protein